MFRNGSCYNVTVLQCYTYVKKFPRQCVSPAPMVENAKGFLENVLMCWWIGEEGVEKDAQKEDTLINMLFLINYLYLQCD